MKKYISFLTLVLILGAQLSPAFAAPPDGAGPWADSVVSYTPGLRKNSSPVPAPRNNPNNAVGVAEGTNANGTFTSLGFRGSLVLGFDNPISNGVLVVEATNLPYPNETASVELSADGTTWIPAGSVTQDGQVSMPESLSCARFARITDTSNPANFSDPVADGYDVDGISAVQGVPCDTPVVPEMGVVAAGLASLGSVAGYVMMKKRQLLG